MITLTLDTSCFNKRDENFLIELHNLEKSNLIEKYHEPLAYIETRGGNVGFHEYPNEKLLRIYSKYSSNVTTGPNNLENDDRAKLFDKLAKILFPEGISGKKRRSHFNDLQILASHIMKRRDFFITQNSNDFMTKGKKEKLEKKISGLKIRLMDDQLIKELKMLTKTP